MYNFQKKNTQRNKHIQNKGQTCYPNPCGINAECRDRSGRPVCSCPAGYRGDPITHCIRSECLDHIECPGHLSCRNGNCVNPCSGQCGINAECIVRNHVPVCRYFCFVFIFCLFFCFAFANRNIKKNRTKTKKKRSRISNTD